MNVIFTYKSGRTRNMEKRYAEILKDLGYGDYAQTGVVSTFIVEPETKDDLSELRAEYQEVFGKKAYHGWSADDLRDKIAEGND